MKWMLLTVAFCFHLLLHAQLVKTEYLDDDFKVLKSAKGAAYVQTAEYNDQTELNGKLTILYIDSMTYMTGFYFNGKRYGKFIWYWPSGVIYKQGTYSADVQIGEWFTYLKDGQQDVYEVFDTKGNLTSTYPNEESIFGYVEDWPAWKGCDKQKTYADKKNCTEEKRQEYLNSCPRPATATLKTPVTVHIYCIIDKTGAATEVHTTLTSGDSEIDKAVEDWVRKMPAHVPGSWHTKTVKVQLNLLVELKT